MSFTWSTVAFWLVIMLMLRYRTWYERSRSQRLNAFFKDWLTVGAYHESGHVVLALRFFPERIVQVRLRRRLMWTQLGPAIVKDGGTQMIPGEIRKEDEVAYLAFLYGGLKGEEHSPNGASAHGASDDLREARTSAEHIAGTSAETMLLRANELADEVLEENLPLFGRLVEELIRNHHLSGDELRALWASYHQV